MIKAFHQTQAPSTCVWAGKKLGEIIVHSICINVNVKLNTNFLYSLLYGSIELAVIPEVHSVCIDGEREGDEEIEESNRVRREREEEEVKWTSLDLPKGHFWVFLEVRESLSCIYVHKLSDNTTGAVSCIAL